MEWDNSVFDEAFDAVGIREPADLVGADPPVRFQVRFDRPGVIDESTMVHSTDYEIEFTTADAPGLEYGSELDISGERYRVRQEPVTVGDGYWTRAHLELLK
ncbi:hypothetical protein [Achromobacter marplatensis]|uniref:head-tail joining protein n=1 Tax=Achromobacter marplatensis TaxID=470868 RepID=UPI0028EC9292|nr:hypothetical protein [Achromobacter marplatensis]